MNDSITFFLSLLRHINQHQPLTAGEWGFIICFSLWCIGMLIILNMGFSITGPKEKE